MQKKLFIMGNWKMNLTVSQSKKLSEEIIAESQRMDLPPEVSVMIAPTYLAISEVAKTLVSCPIHLGVQDMHYLDDGAFTSKISGSMILDTGARFVILGHSELRQFFGETDEIVNKKVAKALSIGLTPVLCVGETLDEREQGKWEQVLQRQVEKGLKGISGPEMRKVIIAYEPVWAIGTGKTASTDEADEAHAFIRSVTPEKISILYGGSMKSTNALELLSCKNIDGGLIGGASLVTKEFCDILAIAKSICLSGNN